MKDISVFIIDDHSLFRDGLCRMLMQHGIRIAGSTGEVQQGIQDILEKKPTVALLDIRMPVMDGIEVLKILRKKGSKALLTMLTTSFDSGHMAVALKNGAQGYLTKNMEPNQFVDAIHSLVKGKKVIAQDMVESYEQYRSGIVKGGEDLAKKLTPREKEVLNLLAEGRSNKVIASQLNIAIGTVKLHVKSVLRKLNVHSRVEAAVWTVEHNLRFSAG